MSAAKEALISRDYPYPMGCAEAAPGATGAIAFVAAVADSDTCSTFLVCDEDGLCGADSYPPEACALYFGDVPGGPLTLSRGSEYTLEVTAHGSAGDSLLAQASLFRAIPARVTPETLPRFVWAQGGIMGATVLDSIRLTLFYTDQDVEVAGISEADLRLYLLAEGDSVTRALVTVQDLETNQLTATLPTWGIVLAAAGIPTVGVVKPVGRARPAGPELVIESGNPTRGRTQLSIGLAERTQIDLAVFDLSGRQISRLFQGALETGRHAFSWDGSDDRGTSARSGLYFVRLRAGSTQVARRVLLRR
jgi:hypothetical protein